MTGDTDTNTDTEFDGERISKVMARAGVCSRRDAERMIAAGRVAINGQTLTTPAVNVGEGDVVTIDGETLATPQEARLWRYHKPPGLVTTHKDPEGRPTVFDQMPKDLPRVVSVGRLDLNSEGLLLLTNDGTLAGKLEHPSTGWMRRYRVRVNGVVDPKKLASVADGVTVEGLHYGPVLIEIERQQATNAWLTVSLAEGKNREIRRVMDHLGYRVNRLIRVAYGPFAIGRLDRGQIEEVPRKMLREALAGFGEAVPTELRKHKPETTAKWAKAKPKPNRPGQAKRKPMGAVAAVRAEGAARPASRPRPDAAGKPRSDRPASDRPRADRPASDRPRAERPRSDRPTSDRPRTDRPASDRPRDDRPRSDRPTSDRPRTDRPTTDRPRADRPRDDRPRSDKPRTDRPRDDKPRAERPQADRPRAAAPAPARGDAPPRSQLKLRDTPDRPRPEAPERDRPDGPPPKGKKRARRDGLPGPRPLTALTVKKRR